MKRQPARHPLFSSNCALLTSRQNRGAAPRSAGGGLCTEFERLGEKMNMAVAVGGQLSSAERRHAVFSRSAHAWLSLVGCQSGSCLGASGLLSERERGRASAWLLLLPLSLLLLPACLLLQSRRGSSALALCWQHQCRQQQSRGVRHDAEPAPVLSALVTAQREPL